MIALQLRAYMPADWPQLCAVHDAARRHELRAAGLDDAFLSLEQAAEGEGLFDGELVVACEGERVLGFAAWAEQELTWLYVDPTAWRRGVGRALLRHVVQASGAGLRTEVLVGNAAALALYLHEGFVRQQTLHGKLAGNESFAASGHVLEWQPAQARSSAGEPGPTG